MGLAWSIDGFDRSFAFVLSGVYYPAVWFQLTLVVTDGLVCMVKFLIVYEKVWKAVLTNDEDEEWFPKVSKLDNQHHVIVPCVVC